MKRRVFSIMMILVLCLCLLPGTALAAETKMISEVQYRIDNGEWEESSLFDALWGGMSAGFAGGTNVEIELLRDITLTNDNWPYSTAFGYTPSWSINGNGHTIFHQNVPQVFQVSGKVVLTLKDITIDGGAVWSGENPGNRINTGISRGPSDNLLVLYEGATVILDQGVILQNNDLASSSAYGAAVFIDQGTLIMREGSAIRNNSAGLSGAGVYVYGGSTFQMEGGEISGNYAGDNSGGVCIAGGTFEMSGGSISGNAIAGIWGGGVLVYNGSLKAGGCSVITDNLSGKSANNVYLHNGNKVAVNGSLSQGAQIGVTVPASYAPTEESPTSITSNASDSKYFSSDDTRYMVSTAGSGIVQLVLREPCIVSFEANLEDEENPEDQKTTEYGTLAALPEITREGYTLDGWYTANQGGIKITTDTVFDTDTTVHARWLENHTVTFVSNEVEIETQPVPDGRTAEKPADPTREGYVFGGWYTDEAGTAAFNWSAPITENVTLYAKWTEAPKPVEPTQPARPTQPTQPTQPSTPGGGSSSGGSSDKSSDRDSGGSSTPALPVTTTGQNSAVRPTETTARPSVSVKDGEASAAVNSATANEIVRQAEVNQSETVIIAPSIPGSVDRTEVSLPASAVEALGSRTDANLTISTPAAQVSIPNGGLSALAGGGGTVTASVERMGNTVDLTLTSGGKTVTSLPGGVTLTVPLEQSTPGTVAALVHAGGAREIIRKSLAAEGGLTVPLEGSARLEILDNSRAFTDVPAWAADAVAFVSARQIFNGTSETTFSPDRPMTRAMLAVALHNLEGNPNRGTSSLFTDVPEDMWCAGAIAWASDAGIAAGYTDGSFAPGGRITREQLAVMLWRYAGSPAPSGRDLPFTDADQAGEYARDALCWAAEKGILNGRSGGFLDPKGIATRAQAAQMLKNYLENL